MSKRLRLRDRIAALESAVSGGSVAGGGGGSTGGGSGGGGGTGGGSSSGEVGIVLPIEAESVFVIDTLPAGDVFEITLDGVLTSPNPPSPVGYLSYARGTGIANDGRVCMVINTLNDGLQAQDVAGDGMTTPITQEEFLAWTPKNNPTFLGPYNQSGKYRLSWNQQGWAGNFARLWDQYDPSGRPLDVPKPPGPDASKDLPGLNLLLTNRGFKPWTALNAPEEALAAAPKNLLLLPNGVSQDTEGVLVGTDGGAIEQTSVADSGLILARAWTGPDWRVLSKGHFSRKSGEKPILTAQCAAVQGPSKRTFNAASSWDDNSTVIESLYLDFDGADFTGTVSIVPKTVVTA